MYFWKYILAKKAGLPQQKCNMALYGLPVLPIAEAFEKTLTGNPISVTDALARDALSLQVTFTPTQDGTPSIDSEPTTEPYLSKVIPRGNREYYSLVGGTVAWNQIVPDAQAHKSGAPTTSSWITTSRFSLISGHKYMLVRSGTYSAENNAARVVSTESPTIIYDHCLPTSGNYQTSVFSCTASRSTYYIQAYAVAEEAYDFYLNVFDLTLMFGQAIADYIYTLETGTPGAGVQWLKDHGFLTKDYYPYNPGELISVNTSGHKIGSTTYPIDPTDLRGLFKLSNGKLYCKGDAYKPDGMVMRNFEYRAYQSGDESLADAITDGTHTVVKLTTPTTESATAYTSPIGVEAGGTEEFIDNRTVPIPVGNETYYASEYAVHGKASVTVSHGATEDDPNPTEYEVEFTSQGTVYGGTVDIVSGVLSVNYGHVDLGTLNYTYENDGTNPVFVSYGIVALVKTPGRYETNYCLCTRYKCGTSTSKTDAKVNMNNGEVQITSIGTKNLIVIRDGMHTNKNSFKAAVNGTILVYELATPLTYQLTTQQVQMLLGDNYLVTEDGTITITYMAGK